MMIIMMISDALPSIHKFTVLQFTVHICIFSLPSCGCHLHTEHIIYVVLPSFSFIQPEWIIGVLKVTFNLPAQHENDIF